MLSSVISLKYVKLPMAAMGARSRDVRDKPRADSRSDNCRWRPQAQFVRLMISFMISLVRHRCVAHAH